MSQLLFVSIIYLAYHINYSSCYLPVNRILSDQRASSLADITGISFKSPIRNLKMTVGRSEILLMSTTDDISSDMILRRIDKWACVKNCGACCKLGPLESRPDLESYLTKDELSTYKSMVGADDWCINYNKETRQCTIYDTRPEFCRIEPKKFKTMFGVEEEDMNVRKNALISLLFFSMSD